MQTTDDIEAIVYKVLVNNITGISGGVYKTRPINSRKEDVVISCLEVTCEQLQNGSVSVNIHVPNLILNINGVQDNSQPNLKRLNELTKQAVGLLDETFTDTYWFYVQNQAITPDSGLNQEHFSNILLNFYSLNSTN